MLITGGGAEMQNIEQLFSRELGIEEVRSVYPEYGFTESLSEKITTRAYATIASLLLYGAKMGSCSIAVRQQPTPTVETEIPRRRSPYGNNDEQREEQPPVRPVPPVVHEPEGSPIPPVRPVHNDGERNRKPNEPVKIDPVKPDTSDSDDIVVEGPKKKRGFKEFFTTLGDIFAGRDDVDTDGI